VEGDTREVDVGDDGKEAEDDKLKVQVGENSYPWLGLVKLVWVMTRNPHGSSHDRRGSLQPTASSGQTCVGHGRDPHGS
jgi:hypothetical protein